MVRPTKRTKKFQSNRKYSSPRPRRKQERSEFKFAQKRAQEFDPKKWEAAISHKYQMSIFSHGNYDPAASVVKNLKQSDIGLFIGNVDNSVSVEPTQNPDERGSFGFIDVFALVSSNSSFIPGTLVLRFDAKKLGSVARETLRLFRWDEDSRSFKKIFTSDVSNNVVDYVWGRITLPGKYAIIGLHSHPLVIRTAKISQVLSDLMSGLNPELQRKLQERICKLILHSPELRQAIEEPDVLKALIQGSAEQGFPNPLNAWKPNPGFESPDYPDNICPDLHHLPEKDDPHLPHPLPEKPGRQTRKLPESGLLSYRNIPEGLFPSTDRWESVGPINISGCMVQVARDPVDKNMIYAAGANGGLWRLDNVIAHPTSVWRPLTDHNDSLAINAFAIAPSENNVIYIADGLGSLLRSRDRGSTWNRTSTTNLGSAYKIIVNPLNENFVFVASDKGFWRSTNGGSTWDSGIVGPTMLPLISGDITDAVMDPANPSILYIGQRDFHNPSVSGLWKSTNSGDSWKLMLPWSRASSPGGTMIKIAVGRKGSDANRTVAVKFDQEIFVNHKGGRPETVAGGEAWVPKFRLTKISLGEAAQSDWGNVIAIDPSEDKVMLTGHIDLYRTVDGGDSWDKVAGIGTLTHEDQHSIMFDPNDSKYVYLSNDGGVFRSKDNGLTWDDINYGLATAQFYHVGVAYEIAVGNLYHSGIIGSGSLMKKEWRGLEGHSWEFSNIYSDPVRPGTFYAFLARSDQIAINLWRRRYYGGDSGKAVILIGSSKPTAIAIDTRTTSNTILVGSDNPGRIISALDGYKDDPHWIPEPGISIGNEAIVSIVFAPSKPSMAYAVSSSGRVFRKREVNDPKENWQQMGQWPKNGVRQLAVNALHENRIYLMTENEVARSVDSGSGSWIDIVGSGKDKLPPSGFNSLLVHPADGRTIFLGADVGVFISTDEGASWLAYDGDLPNAAVNEILYGEDGYLYAATYGRGLWRRSPCL
jgi:photosystem II stability/assembly factor-like uncharacterized protein